MTYEVETVLNQRAVPQPRPRLHAEPSRSNRRIYCLINLALIPGQYPASSPRHTPATGTRRRLRKRPEWTPRTARIPAGENWKATPAQCTSLSPNGNLAQLVEQRTLKTAETCLLYTSDAADE